MIRIHQLKLPCRHTEQELKQAAARKLGCAPESLDSVRILRRSIDARKEPVSYVYSLAVETKREAALLKRNKNGQISAYIEKQYQFTPEGTEPLLHPPVVIGAGPAGLFCALFLARAGYRPLLLERGDAVEERSRRVEAFWNGESSLDPESNVQFGEGGAGTFSDGKLNTLVKDPYLRGQKVLDTLAEFGAPEEIRYVQKPHIGTDRLKQVIVRMRDEFIRLGGTVRFRAKVTDLVEEGGVLRGLMVNGEEFLPCQAAVLAPGHSARDTFAMLEEKGLSLEAKAFAVGLRIEHPQEMIGRNQYGASFEELDAADYKVTHTAAGGRGVYSFCMCPGGFVVNASSEEGYLAVNGMSNYARDEQNANSALIVTVTPEDFPGEGPLAGVAFQRSLEKAAWTAGEGKVPVQLFGDFCRRRPTRELGEIIPNIRGGYRLCNLRDCLPDYISATIEEGIFAFDKKIHGFAREDSVLSGVESRTSSPVRILRDSSMQSSLKGLYPCGEGAGYAGGITSAAMDGIRVFEAIASRYQSFEQRLFGSETGGYSR